MSKNSRKYKSFEELAGKPEKGEEKKDDLQFSPCIMCQKPIGEGYYGRWQNGGTCSKTCEAAQESKPRYVGHTEEDFLMRNESLDHNH